MVSLYRVARLIYPQVMACILAGLVCNAAAVKAQLVTVNEQFLGIPGCSQISDKWLIENPDYFETGFLDPTDVVVIKLSPSDYRFVVLDAFQPFFLEFKINQTRNLKYEDIVHSGRIYLLPLTISCTQAMCIRNEGDFFNPQTDRIAVTHSIDPGISEFSFDPMKGKFDYVRTVTNAQLNNPVGIYYAMGNYFVTDADSQCIFCMDTTGEIIARYGMEGSGWHSYRWITGINGRRTTEDSVQLFLGDGWNGRMDCLTATREVMTLKLRSVMFPSKPDCTFYNPHEIAYIPGAGVIGLDRENQQLIKWSNQDSLRSTQFTLLNLPSGLSWIIRIREAMGRLIIICMNDKGNHSLLSCTLGGVLDNPLPSADQH
jgi:hypothetical protein